MTLVVACSDGEQAWMVADTTITDPAMDVRDRLRDLKIETMHGTSMVGFADNPHHARRIIGSARLVPAGLEALEKLVSGRKAYPRIELAYACWDGHQTHLHKMKTTNGKSEMVATAWLGSKSAFDRLQQAKLEQQKDHSPNASTFFMLEGKVLGKRQPCCSNRLRQCFNPLRLPMTAKSVDSPYRMSLIAMAFSWCNTCTK
jgi:hypothetical protein